MINYLLFSAKAPRNSAMAAIAELRERGTLGPKKPFSIEISRPRTPLLQIEKANHLQYDVRQFLGGRQNIESAVGTQGGGIEHDSYCFGTHRASLLGRCCLLLISVQ